ncbi:hypothetical protein Scep_022690 [Stephania cephalantha]|uniref:Uncharacterized protein n=1 Tax=Stephania cephalantha TaxID=152367 RepID=A0AAP0F5W4_9MAGN
MRACTSQDEMRNIRLSRCSRSVTFAFFPNFNVATFSTLCNISSRNRFVLANLIQNFLQLIDA